MLLYIGKNALSAFRKKKLLISLQKKLPLLRTISAHYIYFVAQKNFSLQKERRLLDIIDSQAKAFKPATKQSLWVTPRFGTISPWASKTLDILHLCGFTEIERIERGVVYQLDDQVLNEAELDAIASLLHDRMTQTLTTDFSHLEQLFTQAASRPMATIPLLAEGTDVLSKANKQHGFALTADDIAYLDKQYQLLKRDPTLTELMMFAQINSEHCRHKLFNAQWYIDGKPQERSLFAMIRHTHERMSQDVLSAYKDNGAVIASRNSAIFQINPKTYHYDYQTEPTAIVIKVETHNHPTAIAPFEGAATGAGGEIRDEGATGRGAKPKAGLTGFSVSNLHIPLLPQPWEKSVGYPQHIGTALDIMLQGPIGAASFNNEFGRPNLCGYFRTYETIDHYDKQTIYAKGYHKPIMIAGGLGQIRQDLVAKKSLPVGTLLVVLGGPAMLIGLGGGAASSLSAGARHEELDFASVQRSNPEMQRRAQEVITACWSRGDENPILSIHDVGAGGLSNALSELIHDSGRGGRIDLRAIPTADPSLNAMEIWCNEAQERYVLGIAPELLPLFAQLAQRERCPFAVVGEVNDTQQLEVIDPKSSELPVNVPFGLLFGSAAHLQKELNPKKSQWPSIDSDIKVAPIDKERFTGIFSFEELIKRVLQLPAVADKSFLITIGDRSVTGLVARDQMVGPWQVPVADVAVTATSFLAITGEAMALGERSPIATLDAAASARMAIGEAITNIAAADIATLSDIKLSANWMAASQLPEEEANLYDAVNAVGMELCPALGLCIPVGKDSLFMQTKWQVDDFNYEVSAPLSLIISAFAPVIDITRTLTPELKNVPSKLLLIDLGRGQNRLGASALAQVTHMSADAPPDLDDPELIKQFFSCISALRHEQCLLAYHDRSDGGLLATVCEMSFASHLGITLELSPMGDDSVAALFNEELGAVIQYPIEKEASIRQILQHYNLENNAHVLGTINDSDKLEIYYQGKLLFEQSRLQLQRIWSETSFHMQSLRDNPASAQQEYDMILDSKNPGLNAQLSFEPPITFPAIVTTSPKVAILREQGVNSHYEMAAAFHQVGFVPVDVHMTDILNGTIDLAQFQGLVACGGFSYGDVLGAGKGWASTILHNNRARDQFTQFFTATNTFVLGVCNGCQMLSQLKTLIPGAEYWPTFTRNQSEQFEARLSLVRVRPSPSVFFHAMDDSIMPIVVSHGEGQTMFETQEEVTGLLQGNLVALQYVDNYGQVTENYPANPNGSAQGITAVTNSDGRFTLMMPHPERSFRTVQFSWHPAEWHPNYSPWIKFFDNARRWLQG